MKTAKEFLQEVETRAKQCKLIENELTAKLNSIQDDTKLPDWWNEQSEMCHVSYEPSDCHNYKDAIYQLAGHIQYKGKQPKDIKNVFKGKVKWPEKEMYVMGVNY